jgi:hypothetical protein
MNPLISGAHSSIGLVSATALTGSTSVIHKNNIQTHLNGGIGVSTSSTHNQCNDPCLQELKKKMSKFAKSYQAKIRIMEKKIKQLKINSGNISVKMND